MEAARIPWRPLGRLLVEQGLLTAQELELALAKQEETGRLLGQTIVECGFVSGPELSNALAAQYGIELIAETGFGTGLRTEIQRRHESERRKIVRPVPDVAEEPKPAADAEPDELGPEAQDEASLHAQLEKQWAKLAAAEELLDESERELAALGHERDRLRGQAERLAQRARRARLQLALLRARRRTQLVRFVGRVRARDVHVARLAADVRGCDVELERLRDENERTGHALAVAQAAVVERDRLLTELRRASERRRAQAVRFLTRLRDLSEDETRTPPPSEHVVFVQLSGRYELVAREGPPPPRNTVLKLPELSDAALVVARLGRSPLPGDTRPCVFVQPGS